MKHRMGRKPLFSIGALALSAGLFASLSGLGANSASAAPSKPVHGGNISVLENSGFIGAWPGLDPATDTSDDANATYMNAIYGGLFEQGPQNQV
ncbi:MAG: hypothetical protein J2P58_10955, partial [Acidimicrobiaceae bacterium]|nr:hypothetical protein [Acidimicrobiaceae bacterium]